MVRRSLLVAWLLTCAALLLPLALDGTGSSLAVAAAALLCAAALSLGVGSQAGLRHVPVLLPAHRRLRGRFLQQSRPGVPGRIRSRAPGLGR